MGSIFETLPKIRTQNAQLGHKIDHSIWNFYHLNPLNWLKLQISWYFLEIYVSSDPIYKVEKVFIFYLQGFPSVVYFDQLSGDCSTRKLVETFFSAVFWPFLFFFLDFRPFLVISRLKSSKNEQKNVKLSTPQSWSTCKITQSNLFSIKNGKNRRKSAKKRKIQEILADT